MAATTYRSPYEAYSWLDLLRQRFSGRGLWFGLILLGALAAFEVFNFSTTEYALHTLFGDMDAVAVGTWARVLALAFCGIDFAGLSRLFTPETGRKEPKEIWLLTGAWFLGASMNAIMTWWAVGSALAANPGLGNELLTRQQILDYAPVFIAILVWFTRILIIGTFAFAGDHIFSTAHPANSRDTVNGTASPARRFGFGRQAAARVTSVSARTRAVPKPNATPSLPPREQPRPSPLPAYASTRETNEYRTGSSSYRAGNTSYRAADDDNGPRRHDNRDSARYGADARATSRSPFGYGSGYSQSGYSQPGYGQATSPAASIRQNTPTSGGSRASSVRTLGTAPSAPTAASQAASLPVQASMELEYVDVT